MKTVVDLRQLNDLFAHAFSRQKRQAKFLALLDLAIVKADEILAENIKSNPPKSLLYLLDYHPKNRGGFYPEFSYFNQAITVSYWRTESRFGGKLNKFEKLAAKYGLIYADNWEGDLSDVRMTVDYDAKAYPKYCQAIIRFALEEVRVDLFKKHYHDVSQMLNKPLWRAKPDPDRQNDFEKSFIKFLLSDVNSLPIDYMLDVHRYVFQDNYSLLRALSQQKAFHKVVRRELEQYLFQPESDCVKL
ncbi:MAG: hypothetical protein WCK37_04055 [Candidatus Falkowbacteria bacterium]